MKLNLFTIAQRSMCTHVASHGKGQGVGLTALQLKAQDLPLEPDAALVPLHPEGNIGGSLNIPFMKD